MPVSPCRFMTFFFFLVDFGCTDIKADNVSVSLKHVDNHNDLIAAYLARHPSTTYLPREAPFLSPEPVITVKSEPLPNFGLLPDLSNLHVELVDFSSGRSPRSAVA
jgi:serine/threonine-protein kinase SRPK3